ncbi:hypothetical protein BC940DRAFT_333370 [Gongronella butleri]|nr:hypothetical protein BC940DRAFT_333370 [Gongronella butleri]
MKAPKTKRAKATVDPSPTRAQDLASALVDRAYPGLACVVCKQVSRTRDSLYTHFKKDHKGVKAYKCVDSTCTQKFSTLQGLTYHLSMAHTLKQHGDRIEIVASTRAPPQARKNGLSAPLSETLKMHYSENKCPKCGDTFDNKTLAKNHIVAAHPKEKLFFCFIAKCPHTVGFASLAGLSYHLSQHH